MLNGDLCESGAVSFAVLCDTIARILCNAQVVPSVFVGWLKVK
jgi:hypothetical protein